VYEVELEDDEDDEEEEEEEEDPQVLVFLHVLRVIAVWYKGSYLG